MAFFLLECTYYQGLWLETFEMPPSGVQNVAGKALPSLMFIIWLITNRTAGSLAAQMTVDHLAMLQG